MAWQRACCSVTLLFGHVAHQQNNSWVNIDCLTGCLICLSSHRPPLPVHSRTMSSNTNIFFKKRTQVIFSSSPFITVDIPPGHFATHTRCSWVFFFFSNVTNLSQLFPSQTSATNLQQAAMIKYTPHVEGEMKWETNPPFPKNSFCCLFSD